MRRLAAVISLAMTSIPMFCGDTQAAATTPSPNGVSFIHDDYAAALQRARASRLPLFVKIWSPW